MPFFSIISPVYNTGKYLRDFLDSVLKQSFSDFELILIDDGSTDNSLEICRKYADRDSRIHIFTQSNKGAGAARNKGIDEAKGEYILFFDSDDWIAEEGLMFLASETHNNPDELLIFGSTEVHFDRNECEIARTENLPIIIETKSMRETRDVFCDLIFSSAINVPWNKVYRRSIIVEHGVVFADTRRAQDAFFNMEYYKYIERVRTVQKAIYFYRENTQDKIWKKFPKDLYKIDMQYDEYLVNIFREFGIYSGEKREKVDTLFYNSIIRTVGFCYNPMWGLNHKQKLLYIEEIINNPYNKQRAETALALTEKTKKIQKQIVEGNAKRLLNLYNYLHIRSKLFDFYIEKIKTKR